MASTIRIKRSGVSGNPGTLAAGELAYSALPDTGSNGGDRLYIGFGTETGGNAANHIVIGGKYFTDMLDHTLGVLTTSSAIVVDSNRKIDQLLVDNLDLNGNTITTTDANGNLVLTANGSGQISFYSAYTFPRTAGTTGQALVYDGAGGLTWAGVTTANTATNLAGGTAGQVPYQTAPGVTSFYGPGTAGQLLVSAGTGAPTYTNTGSIYVGRAVLADSATTATSAATAYATIGTHTAGTGLTGTSFNGSANQTWTLNTATLMATAVLAQTATTATSAATAYAWLGGTVANPVTFSGAVTFSGTTTYVYSTQTVYTDNILQLHIPPAGPEGAWTLDDGKDVGFKFHYYTAGADTNAALVLANDTKYLEWYSSGAEGTSTFAGSAYGTFKTGQIKLASTTAASSTSTGALTVEGGVGVGGSLYVGGTIYSGGTALQNFNTSTLVAQSVTAQSATTATSAGTAYALATTSTTYVGRAATADKWTSPNTITLGGDLSGSVQIDGSGNATLTATIAANSVALGTDTTGDYVSNGATSGFGLSGSTTGEGQTFTVTANSTSSNTLNSIVYRNGSGDFAAGVITASFTGNLTGTASTATNLAGGAANQIPYQTSAGVSTFLSAGSYGQVLQVVNTATGAFAWGDIDGGTY